MGVHVMFKDIMVVVFFTLNDSDLGMNYMNSYLWWQAVTQLFSWWHHDMETFSVLLAFCKGNPPDTRAPIQYKDDILPV